jgi:pimeloyl-ACP methyl ester carboxylesterase
MASLRKLHDGSADHPAVIFIHGLGGDPIDTWRHTECAAESCWPHWVGEDTDCDVWVLDYDAGLSAWRDQAMPLPDQGDQVLDLLQCEPRLKGRELVLIGHSLGGLVIKTSIVSGQTKGIARYAGLVGRIRGVVFIATPHAGSHLANLARAVRWILRPNEQVGNLQAHDAHLRSLNEQFRHAVDALRLEVRVYAERQGVPLGRRVFNLTLGPTVKVVSETSADPGLPGVNSLGMAGDHFSICKPASRSEHIHVSLCDFLAELMKRGRPSPIGARDVAPESGPSIRPVRIFTALRQLIAVGASAPDRSVYCANLNFRNDPVASSPDAAVSAVLAEIRFLKARGEVLKINTARWGDADQPAVRLAQRPFASLNDLNTVPFQIGEQHQLNVAIKHPQQEWFYAFDNTSYAHDNWENPSYRLVGDEYDVAVRLRGPNIDAEYTFVLWNPGPEQGFVFSQRIEPAPPALAFSVGSGVANMGGNRQLPSAEIVATNFGGPLTLVAFAKLLDVSEGFGGIGRQWRFEPRAVSGGRDLSTYTIATIGSPVRTATGEDWLVTPREEHLGRVDRWQGRGELRFDVEWQFFAEANSTNRLLASVVTRVTLSADRRRLNVVKIREESTEA